MSIFSSTNYTYRCSPQQQCSFLHTLYYIVLLIPVADIVKLCDRNGLTPNRARTRSRYGRGPGAWSRTGRGRCGPVPNRLTATRPHTTLTKRYIGCQHVEPNPLPLLVEAYY